VIFAIPLFSHQLFSLKPDIFLGFIILCLISSSNYIVNDILDRKKDRLNPEKKGRPIAAGKISVKQALYFFLMVFLFGLVVSLYINELLLLIVLALFTNTQLYSFFLKSEPYLDVIAIGLNFILRVLAGHAFVDAKFGHWLIMSSFFLALILASAKRYSEFKFLKLKRHRSVLKKYDEKNLLFLLYLSTTLFLISISVFPFFSDYAHGLFIILPIAFYLCLYYVDLVLSGSIIARHLELAWKDRRLIIAGAIYALLALLIIYLNSSFVP
jgi:4-hydroxybenzoate polyprenyltransferase